MFNNSTTIRYKDYLCKMFNVDVPEVKQNNLKEKAYRFLELAYGELEQLEELPERLEAVARDISKTGTWYPTTEELTQGARMAWRNSNRCIGRLYWKTLKVIDARHLKQTDEIFNALQQHIDFAFNEGQIRSTITIFRAKKPHEVHGPRMLNHQLIRYAGHKQPDGTVTGDPASLDFTQWCINKGIGFEGTAFDLLPQAIQWPDRAPEIRELKIPEKMLVELEHPDYPWFKDLQLQWYALPLISDMLLEIGGLEFTAAPFNGWYMGTEIGSRNLGDAHRYNLLPLVADKLGLDKSNQSSLWKDRAMLELNRSVLYSFEKAGITISNHHDAAGQFIHFEETENKKGREIRADWSWITPPMSGSATPVFHRNYNNEVTTPNFFYQDPLIHPEKSKPTSGCPFHQRSLSQ
jgi:nitric-oxide synthase, bacterial